MKKIGRADEEFIANHRNEMSVRELADALGVSKTTVQRACKRMRLQAEPRVATPAAVLPAPADLSGCDELVLLKALADQLWPRVCRASDKELARLTREYRETLMRITELEGGGAAASQKEKGEGDLFDAACHGSA